MAALQSQLSLNEGMISEIKRVTGALSLCAASFEQVRVVLSQAFGVQEIVSTKMELYNANAAIEEMEVNIQDVEKKQTDVNKTMKASNDVVAGLLGKIKKMASAFGTDISVKKIIELSDTISSIPTRLGFVVDDGGSVSEFQERIMALANRTRAPFQATVDSVVNLGQQASSAFSGTDEILAFTELMNKNFVIGSASIQDQAKTMEQVTQAMASGKLQGDGLKSITKNAPMLAGAIETYMRSAGVEGTIKDWESAGLLTADVIKNALFSSTDEINKKFSEISMTWEQVRTVATNAILDIGLPIIQIIGQGAQWIFDNWSTIAPIFWGIAAAVGAYLVIMKAIALWNMLNTAGTIAYNVVLAAKSIAMGIVAFATGNSALAQNALNMAMRASPIGWIILGIALLVGWIYKWVQSVGGIKIAWAMVTMTIANNVGDMKVNVLMTLQGMLNGAIDLINEFITYLNTIPGVNLELISQLTFGTQAQLENEAAKQARLDSFAELQANHEADIANAVADIDEQDWKPYNTNKPNELYGDETTLGGFGDSLGEIEANTGSVAQSLDNMSEDLVYMRDIAEREAINRFTTAEIRVDMTGMTNRIDSSMDVDGVINRFVDGITEALSVTAEGVHA